MRRFARFTPRATNSRSRFPSRPRSKFRDPGRQGRLERADFYIRESNNIGEGSEAQLRIYTHLASIALSFGDFSAGSPEQRVGAVMQSMQRAILINGIVMDYGWEFENLDGEPSGIDAGAYTGQVSLLTDRLSISSGGSPQPTTLGVWSPYETNFPTAALGTSTPSLTSESDRHPTRVHWQRTTRRFAVPQRILADEAEVLYVPTGQAVSIQAPTLNRRLRIRLDDFHGFFLGWHFISDAGNLVGITIHRWARGTFWYRYVQ